MEEYDPFADGPWRPDLLSHDEFMARYEAVHLLLIEAREHEDDNLHDIMSEELLRLSTENPNAFARLCRVAEAISSTDTKPTDTEMIASRLRELSEAIPESQVAKDALAYLSNCLTTYNPSQIDSNPVYIIAPGRLYRD